MKSEHIDASRRDTLLPQYKEVWWDAVLTKCGERSFISWNLLIKNTPKPTEMKQTGRFLQAIHLNNVGAESMLQIGKRTEAIRALTLALELSKQSLTFEGNMQNQSSIFVPPEDNQEEAQHNKSSGLPLDCLLIIPLASSSRENVDIIPCDTGNRTRWDERTNNARIDDTLLSGDDSRLPTFVFQQPMRFVYFGALSSLSTPVMPFNIAVQTVLVSVIVFNLALANQLVVLEDHTAFSSCNIRKEIGMEFCNGDSFMTVNRSEALDKKAIVTKKHLLERVIELYKFSINLHLIEHCVNLEFDAPIHIASLNNLAQAYFMLGESRQSEYYFHKLLSLMLLNTDSRLSYERSPRAIRCLDGIWRNLSYIIFPVATIARLAPAA